MHSTSTPKLALEAQDLRCRRGGRTVFAGLGFHLENHEALILRGPNGSGKSSLLRLLAGLLPAESGALSINGERLGRRADLVGALCLYAGHALAVKSAFSVRDNLLFWARYLNGRRASDTDIDAALCGFELNDLADLPARILSAGQQKRLSLARLLIADRPIWLLDEPTVALDSQNQDRLFDHVKQHLTNGGLLIAATHMPLGFEGKVLDLSDYQSANAASDFFTQELEAV